MHIIVTTEEFKKVLDVVSRVSTKHITLPILQCVVLSVNNKKLTLRATNLEIGIEGSVPTESTEDGSVAVPAHTLLQTINLISQKNITLSTEGDILHIETSTSKTDIKTMDVGEFPTIPHIEGVEHTINTQLFALGIKTVAFAASQSSIKPELGSVYAFQKREHSLTFVATDSFRLIEKTIPQKGLVFEGSILIPFKNALEIARVADASESASAQFSIHENQCSLTIDNLYITSRLVSGTFPDYEQIIPKEYASEAVVLTQDLGHALKKTNIFLNKFMQLTLTLSQHTLTLSSQNSDDGATTESVKAVTSGGDIQLNFNQRYVGEVVGHLTDESVQFKFAGIGRPMVIQNVHDTSLRYLVMPMNK